MRHLDRLVIVLEAAVVVALLASLAMLVAG
jgi:hypothetical protein